MGVLLLFSGPEGGLGFRSKELQGLGSRSQISGKLEGKAQAQSRRAVATPWLGQHILASPGPAAGLTSQAGPERTSLWFENAPQGGSSVSKSLRLGAGFVV